ncbi:hypothetical protein FRX31_003965 [Thalictrum thalictroides]|uniref:Uncharacterized protein n=1 Tax=Thalictrum thalictroides TaxID=46969 RepID=A0A7J6X9N5_THATH|nr:hypothetical protein FRX31_003965 [Thalictrum thalictroides]
MIKNGGSSLCCKKRKGQPQHPSSARHYGNGKGPSLTIRQKGGSSLCCKKKKGSATTPNSSGDASTMISVGFLLFAWQ